MPIQMNERREKLTKQIINLLNDDGLLIFPTFPHVAPFHGQDTFITFNMAYLMLFNILGLPAVSCPVGRDKNGMPIGVQLIAAPFQERLLVQAAKQIELAFGGWKQPMLEEQQQVKFEVEGRLNNIRHFF